MPNRYRPDQATGIKSGPFEWLTKTGTYTMEVADRAVKVSGTFALTLPALTEDVAESYLFKQTGAGTITLTPQGSDTIDRDADFDMVAEDESVVLVADVTNADWVIR